MTRRRLWFTYQDSRSDDFAELAHGYNGMADAIEQRDKLLAKAEQENGATCCAACIRPG